MTTSLSEKIAQSILDAIISGKIRQQDPFPSQYQLGQLFGVSRTVIREATQILVSKGILEVKHGKRITILPPSHDQITESVSLAFLRKNISLIEVLELRKVLEVEIVAFAALKAEESDIESLKLHIETMKEHLTEEIGYVDADVVFHKAIFMAAKKPAFELVLNSLNDYLFESRRKSYRGPLNTMRAVDSHQQILEAIEERDPEKAQAAMRKHLENTLEDLMNSD